MCYFLSTLLTDALIVPAAFEAILGRRPSITSAWLSFRRIIVALLIAWLLLGVISALLFISLVGIPVFFYLAVRWSFLIQELVREPGSPFAALRRSGGLVQGFWWRCLGINVAIVLLSLLPGLAIQPIVRAVNASVVVVALTAVATWVATPFTAVARTVLYADLKLRKGERLQDRAAAGE
jgi:hypothetical protein